MSHSQLYKMARKQKYSPLQDRPKDLFYQSELIDWLKQHPRKRNKYPNDYGHK